MFFCFQHFPSQIFHMPPCTSVINEDSVISCVLCLDYSIVFINTCYSSMIQHYVPHIHPYMCPITSHASNLGLYLHQGSICLQKSILKQLSHPKKHFMKVFGLMKLPLWILFVTYCLVISLQKLVKDIFVFLTSDMKSCPISSPAGVLLE